MNAMAILILIEVGTIVSFFSYKDFFLKRNDKMNVFSLPILIPLTIVWLIKWFAFINDDKWRNYVNKFDQWPKEKNVKGTWIVIGVIIILGTNIVLSINLARALVINN
jgi:hypothetical protein